MTAIRTDDLRDRIAAYAFAAVLDRADKIAGQAFLDRANRRTRAGPFAIGVFASLKLFPILYGLAYVASGQWHRAALAVAVAIGLQ